MNVLIGQTELGDIRSVRNLFHKNQFICDMGRRFFDNSIEMVLTLTWLPSLNFDEI